jgi:hypothetical protein
MPESTDRASRITRSHNAVRLADLTEREADALLTVINNRHPQLLALCIDELAAFGYTVPVE